MALLVLKPVEGLALQLPGRVRAAGATEAPPDAVLAAASFQCHLPQPWRYLAYSECSINVCGKWEELSSLFPGMDLHPEEQGLWNKELKMWFSQCFY